MSEKPDVNWKPFGIADSGRHITSLDWYPPAVLADWDDLFKCSGCTDLTVQELYIPAGSREDSIDCVRGSGYKFLSCIVRGSVTIKGSINGWHFKQCILDGKIEIGQFDKYWYPGRPPTRGGIIDSCTAKVLWLWDAEQPIIFNTLVKVRKVPKVLWYPYFLYRYVVVNWMQR